MHALPVSITRVGQAAIAVEWSDGERTVHTASRLRQGCPCATCREKESAKTQTLQPKGLPVLSLAEARPLTIMHMRPVGNYAYGITFSDGHDSGIFTFECLRKLGEASSD